MQKVKDRYHNYSGKEKASGYYLKTKDVLKENAKNKYRNLYEEKKEGKKDMEEMDIKNERKNKLTY